MGVQDPELRRLEPWWGSSKYGVTQFTTGVQIFVSIFQKV